MKTYHAKFYSNICAGGPIIRAQSLFFALGAPVLPGVNFWAHGQNFSRTGKNFRSTIRILGVLKGKVREASDILEVTINRYLFSIAIMCLFLSISRLVFPVDIRQLKLILLAIFSIRKGSSRSLATVQPLDNWWCRVEFLQFWPPHADAD